MRSVDPPNPATSDTKVEVRDVLGRVLEGNQED
jgi:hypothetical protein